ncbi:MAG: ApaG domain, partial [Pedosphaera sp.]|nr:ApaG domain [Pedosphaera sp.]
MTISRRAPGCHDQARIIREVPQTAVGQRNRSSIVFRQMGTIGEMIELPGLKVTVDRLLYQRLRADQSDKPHSFIYFISIHNDSPVPVTIRGRKWVVTHEDETVLVVEGDGVVGET